MFFNQSSMLSEHVSAQRSTYWTTRYCMVYCVLQCVWRDGPRHVCSIANVSSFAENRLVDRPRKALLQNAPR